MMKKNITDLKDITKKRANTKSDLDFELNYVTPLLGASPEKANDIAPKVRDSIKKVESLVTCLEIMGD